MKTWHLQMMCLRERERCHVVTIQNRSHVCGNTEKLRRCLTVRSIASSSGSRGRNTSFCLAQLVKNPPSGHGNLQMLPEASFKELRCGVSEAKIPWHRDAKGISGMELLLWFVVFNIELLVTESLLLGVKTGESCSYFWL